MTRVSGLHFAFDILVFSRPNREVPHITLRGTLDTDTEGKGRMKRDAVHLLLALFIRVCEALGKNVESGQMCVAPSPEHQRSPHAPEVVPKLVIGEKLHIGNASEGHGHSDVEANPIIIDGARGDDKLAPFSPLVSHAHHRLAESGKALGNQAISPGSRLCNLSSLSLSHVFASTGH